MEEAVLKFADHYQSLGDRALQASTAVSLLGKSGQQAHGAFKDGAQAIKDYMKVLENMGVYGEKDKALADTYEKVQRYAKLKQEAAEQQAFVRFGAAGQIGWDKIRSGQEGGWGDYLGSWAAYMASWSPSAFLAGASYQPKEVRDMLAKMEAEKGKAKPVFDPNAQAAKPVEEAMEAGSTADRDAIWALNAAMRTRAEKAEDELFRLQDLFSTGMLGDETYERALKNLQRGFDKPKMKGAKEADVDEAGSQEWAKAFNRTSEGIEDKTEDQLQEDRRQTEVLKRIEDAIKTTKPKVLNAPP
jgi:hypothetical protein